MQLALPRLAALVLFGLLSAPASAAEPLPTLGIAKSGERRVALVIGNAAYPGAGALRNPANDASDFAAKLKRLGFDVTVHTDMRYRDMLRSLTDFGDKVQAGSEALFFYAGHGMQVRGKNYLIPIDAEIRNESSVSSEAVDVDQLLDKLSPARLSLVILDACRNNPFERRFRGNGQGLAQINAPTGTLIAYATAPGKVAADGDGRNGLYTAELLTAMDVPGMKIEDVFKRIRGNVVKKSNDAQTPWESSSLTGDFYFRPSEAGSIPTAPPAPATINTSTIELAFWESVKNSTDGDDFQSYLDRFPNGQFAELAERRVKKKPAKVDLPLIGKWLGNWGEFHIETAGGGLRVVGSSRLTPKDVLIDYTTWGPPFVAQDVPIQFMATTTSGSLKGTWKRDTFKAAACNIPSDEGTFDGEISPSNDRVTLRFAMKRYRVLVSRQLLWEDECKEMSVASTERKELVLSR